MRPGVAPAIATVAEYRVIRELGRGAMGAVYLAEDPALDRQVAIKRMAGFRDHVTARARFSIEARAIARLAHPNVVAVYRTGEDGGEPYIVYEYVEGTTLDRLGPLPPARRHAIALGMARGLAAAHARGILHRDLKPSNVIVTADGTAKLLDFGLAKLDGEAAARGGDAPALDGDARAALDEPTRPGRDRDGDDPLATRTFAPPPSPPPQVDGARAELTLLGARLGTPRYMSPEAWRGERLTAASDVFSLGLVLWELFAGRHPLADVAGSALERASAAVPSLAGTGVPARVAAVVDRAVRAAPEQRFADGEQLRLALERALTRRRARWAWAAAGVPAALALGAWWSSSSPPGAAPAREWLPPVPRQLTSLGSCATEPAFVDGGTIAFTVEGASDSALWSLAGAGPPAPLLDTPDWDWRPVAGHTPDEVLFVQSGDDTDRVMELSRAAGAATAVVDGIAAVDVGDALVYLPRDEHPPLRERRGAVDRELARLPSGMPAWDLAASPDGRTIAVVASSPETSAALCTVTRADGAVRCFATDHQQDGAVAFSPDGRGLYYAARAGIRRIDLATGADTLALPGVRGPGGIAIAADGRRLVYSDCHSYGSIVATTGGPPTVVVGDGLVVNPARGPDGGLLVLRQRDGGGTRLVLVRPGAPEREVVADTGELGRPALAPDGRAIVYSLSGSSRGIRSLSLVDGAITAWTQEAGDRDPQWLPGGGVVLDRARDGARALVTVTEPGGPATTLLAGARLFDVDPRGRRLLVGGAGHALAWLDPASGALVDVPLGLAAGAEVVTARVAADGSWLVVQGGADGNTFYRIDQGRDRVTVLQASATQVDSPALLADGRLVYRTLVRRGELWQVEGAW